MAAIQTFLPLPHHLGENSQNWCRYEGRVGGRPLSHAFTNLPLQTPNVAWSVQLDIFELPEAHSFWKDDIKHQRPLHC